MEPGTMDAGRNGSALVLLLSVPRRCAALAAGLASIFFAALTATAAAREPQTVPSPSAVDVARVGAALKKTPPPQGHLRLDAGLPVAVFRTSVEQRVYVMTFQEWLRKEFTLTPLQRQSQDWSRRCCGIDLLGLIDSLDRKLKRREERKIREQVLRELAAVEAAAKGP